MKSIILRQLSAQHQPTERDVLEFSHRIKSDHYFSGIIEELEWLDTALTGNTYNILDEGDPEIDVLSNPVLVMNIIDESICSMIYHIFKSHKDGDNHTLSYYRFNIREYLGKIDILHKKAIKEDNHMRIVLTQLLNVMRDIYCAAIPVSDVIDEEEYYEKLSRGYYCLMYFICNRIKPRQQYFYDLGEFYRKRAESERGDYKCTKV